MTASDEDWPEPDTDLEDLRDSDELPGEESFPYWDDDDDDGDENGEQS